MIIINIETDHNQINMEYGIKQLQIISVAERLFASKGFAGTSIRDIAHEAEINISMISYYFGSKEKLIEALFDVRMVESRSIVENILKNLELSPIQKINIWIEAVVDRLMTSQHFHNIMMREQLSSGSSPSIMAHIQQLKLRNIDLLRQLIEQGRDRGVFRDNLDLSLMVTTVYGTINQAMASQGFYRKFNNLESLSDTNFQDLLTKRLKNHLKNIFINTVVNENYIQK